jgi:hypothetical protein
MKITLDLPDDLLIEAKAVAARQRTTFKAMVERALRREIVPRPDQDPDTSALIEVGRLEILRLRNSNSSRGLEESNRLVEQIEDEELQDSIRFARGDQP